jgi:hypothetical protein
MFEDKITHRPGHDGTGNPAQSSASGGPPGDDGKSRPGGDGAGRPREDGAGQLGGDGAGEPRGDGAGRLGGDGGGGPPVSLEVLEAQICQLAGQLAAANCRFLELLADFDARRGWAAWDMPSCAAWLSWKCQMAGGTAREHVRVARALPRLPVIRDKFAAGRFSFSKVRALTRIATPGSDADLAEMAAPMTASQLDRFARAHRVITAAEDEAVRLSRRLTWRHNDDGSLSLSVRLPPEDGAAVLTALRAAVTGAPPASPGGVPAEAPGAGPGGVPAEAPDAGPGGVPAEAPDAGPGRVPAGTPAPGQPAAGPGALLDPGRPRPTSTSLADALVEIAGAFIAGKTRDAQNPDIYQVIIHATPDVLTPAPGPGPDHPAATAPAPGTSGTSPDNPGAAGTTPGTIITAPDVPGTAQDLPGTAPDARKAAPGARGATPSAVPDAPHGRGAAPATAAAAPGRSGRRPARRCHLQDGPAISPQALQAIACDAVLSWISHDTHGNTLDAGRRHRQPAPALRRALASRDHGRCRFPGCDRRASQAHHITWWIHGGPTSLDNLISLCTYHHRLIHQAGYTITTPAPGQFTFHRPGGDPIPGSPPLPAPSHQLHETHDAEITPATIVPAWYGERLDLDFALTILFANQDTRQAREQEQATQGAQSD